METSVKDDEVVVNIFGFLDELIGVNICLNLNKGIKTHIPLDLIRI